MIQLISVPVTKSVMFDSLFGTLRDRAGVKPAGWPVVGSVSRDNSFHKRSLEKVTCSGAWETPIFPNPASFDL